MASRRDRSEDRFEDIGGDGRQHLGHSRFDAEEGAANVAEPHCWRGLIERYVDRELAIYVEVGERYCERFPNDSRAAEYGVVLYWPWATGFNELETEILQFRRKLNLHRAEVHSGQVESAVLVGIREFLEMPQGAFGALPCAKGLVSLDQCDSVLANTLQMYSHAPSIESLFPFLCLENGELILAAGRRLPSGCENYEFPNDVVQRGSKVVDDFADADAPHWIWMLGGMGPNGQDSRCNIELTTSSVRFRIGAEEGRELGAQKLCFLACSREFQAYAGKRITHGASTCADSATPSLASQVLPLRRP